jgi:hypothetical protein
MLRDWREWFSGNPAILCFMPMRNISEDNMISLLFPSPADNTLRGSRLPFYLLVLTAVIWTVRSCIHLFSPDGGAGSIAGMDLSVSGASEVIFAFALWGAEQLIYSLLQWIVLLRYRSLVPLMWAVQLLETLGRVLAGRLKPVTFAHTPPGEVGNYVYIVLSAAMLALALWSGSRAARRV